LTSQFFKLRKARKRAQAAIRLAQRRLRKYRKRINSTQIEEISQTISLLKEARKAKDLERIDEAIAALDVCIERHLGELLKHPFIESIESIGTAVLIALFLRAFFIEAFTIPSGSMIPTLAVGDFLFINKLAYGIRLPFSDNPELETQWSQPERGDVIVFVYPCDHKLDFIKRVVALPGDEVYATADGYLYINGEAIQEGGQGVFKEYPEYQGSETQHGECPENQKLHLFDVQLKGSEFNTLRCGATDGSPSADMGYFPPPDKNPNEWNFGKSYRRCPPTLNHQWVHWTVPEGHVFVMGDNRENSQDSRYWGFVPMGLIKGKAMFMFMSWDGAGSFKKPWEKIRWDRLFSPVHGRLDD